MVLLMVLLLRPFMSKNALTHLSGTGIGFSSSMKPTLETGQNFLSFQKFMKGFRIKSMKLMMTVMDTQGLRMD